jgi:peptidoglycan/xylan/chitin deacetylase (PgdA/CDA1 family)
MVRWLILAWNVVAPMVAAVMVWRGQMVAGVAVLASAHGLWLYATLMPGCGWWGPVARKCDEAGAVWLTIDDGPDPVDTPRLLDLLDGAGAKATFFVIGEKVARHPQLVREILRRGHRVGNHTMTHPAGWFWALTRGRVRMEIVRCQEAVRTAADGYECVWFRAPAGLRNHAVHPELADLGLRLAGWTVRGFDGVSAEPELVLRRLKAGLRSGAGVLMHEGRQARDGSRLAPSVLVGLLGAMKEAGLATGFPREGAVTATGDTFPAGEHPRL